MPSTARAFAVTAERTCLTPALFPSDAERQKQRQQLVQSWAADGMTSSAPTAPQLISPGQRPGNSATRPFSSPERATPAQPSPTGFRPFRAGSCLLGTLSQGVALGCGVVAPSARRRSGCSAMASCGPLPKDRVASVLRDALSTKAVCDNGPRPGTPASVGRAGRSGPRRAREKAPTARRL